MTAVQPSTFDQHPSPLRDRDADALVRSGGTDALTTMHRAAGLALDAAHTVPDRQLLDRLDRLVASGGVESLAAVEVIGALIGGDADVRLHALVHADDPLLRRHAIWRLGARRPLRSTIPAIAREVQRGGIDTFHAHRTLRRWSEVDPTAVLRTVSAELAAADDDAVRARLVDLLGAIHDPRTDAHLVDVAVDESEPVAARIAAIGGLGERHGDLVAAALAELERYDDLIGAHAALALDTWGPGGDAVTAGGLRIAQLVMSDGLDGRLSRGGRGETGGVASLLVSLSAALAAHPLVDHVLTIGRGSVHDALVGPLADVREPCSFGAIAVGDPARPVTGAADAWEHVPAVERGVRRMLRLAGPIDVLHLRMADVGTIVGAEVAASMGVATCFSLAPDPHNVIQSLEGRGELDDPTFARLEADQHLWLRARTIERLAAEADRVAVFPRTGSLPFLDALDRDATPGRVAVVAEGIDLRSIRHAADESARGDTPDVVLELAERIPADRRELPLLLSVGRLDPVKGMERVVAGWAARPDLRSACNLVIIGGDLADPTRSEQRVLAEIDRTLERHPGAREGIVLLGGRPHADVARLLTAAAHGRPGAWAPGGAYIDGALKEEFGLAVLEAMMSGLAVVAPSTGGPSTYVDHGDTGVLVGPADDLADAALEALALAGAPGRAERARRLVESRYSIETMATQLVDLYGASAAATERPRGRPAEEVAVR